MANCQLCGSPVTVAGNFGKCSSCGAEYDVIRNGTDYSKSSVHAVNGALIPTQTGMALFLSPYIVGTNTPAEGKTLNVGAQIAIVATLYDTSGNYLDGKGVDIYMSLNGGAYSKIATVTIGATNDFGFSSHGGFAKKYTLSQAGSYQFYAEFAGDSTYAGCGKTIHGLKIQPQHYSKSQTHQVTVTSAVTPPPPPSVLPSAGQLLVVVKDRVLKTPIVGATVTVDTQQGTTDENGQVTFNLVAGTYTLTASASSYFTGTTQVSMTSAGLEVDVYLWPVALVIAGSTVGAVTIIGIAAAALMGRKRR